MSAEDVVGILLVAPMIIAIWAILFVCVREMLRGPYR